MAHLVHVSLRNNPGWESTTHQRLRGVLAVRSLSRHTDSGIGTIYRSISDLGLEDESIIPIAEWLSFDIHGKELVELGLHQNKIGQRGCKMLCQSLTTHSCLTDVSVYSNQPGTFWGVEMSKVLMDNRVLLALDMGGCGVGDAGAIALADALRWTNSIEKEQETNSNVRMRGSNCTLTDLHLDHCGIGDLGMNALSTALEHNTTLTNLWLHGNKGNDIMSHIQELLRRNRALHTARRIVRHPPLSLNETFQMLVCRGERSMLEGTKFTFVVHEKERLGSSVATASMRAYHQLCPEHVASWRGGQTVLSTVVLTHEDMNAASQLSTLCGSVVALGVGTKFLTPEVVIASPNDVVRDSHAEVLARRCFVRYLHGQLASIMSNSMENTGCIFELGLDQCNMIGGSGGGDGSSSSEGSGSNNSSNSSNNSSNNSSSNSSCNNSSNNSNNKNDSRPSQFRLKKGYKIHLYTSLAPCGAASLSSISSVVDGCKEAKNNNNDGNNVLLAKRGAPSPSLSTSSSPSLAGGFERIKCPSDVVGNPTRRLSCTDKIVRWQHLGMQGGRLSSLVSHAPSSLSPSTIVIGRRYDAARCTRALACNGTTHVLHGEVIHSSCLKEKTKETDENSSSTFSLEGEHSHGSAAFGSTTGRSMGGDGDECLTWSAGDLHVGRHDGRTGLPMIPSSDVLERFGEQCSISTTEMTHEFDALWLQWWGNSKERMVTGHCGEGQEDAAVAFVSPAKLDVASKEWLELRTRLYFS